MPPPNFSDLDEALAKVPQEHMQVGPASALDTLKTVTEHAAMGALQGVNPVNIVKGIWETGKNTIGDVTAGNYSQAALDLAGLTKAHRTIAMQKAEEAWNKGNHLESFLHTVSSIAPLVGPLADDTVSKFADGVREKDPAKIGDAMGNILSVLSPSALKFTKALPPGVAKSVEASAAENYMNTIRPIEPVTAARSAQRAANDLAAGDAPFAMTRQSFIDKMTAKAKQAGADAKSAIDYNTTGAVGDATDLKSRLLKYAYDNYTNPSAAGNRVPRNHEGLAAIAELSNEIDKASAPGPVPPGVVAPGQTPPSGRPVIPHETVENMRRDREQTSGGSGNLTPTGTWRDRVNPDTAARIDRAHARIIRGWQDDHAPDIQERRDPIRTAAEMRDRLQDAQNKDIAGVPKDIPFFAAIKQGKMPRMATSSVPIETAKAAIKAQVAKALASGDWTKTALALRGGNLLKETDTEEGR